MSYTKANITKRKFDVVIQGKTVLEDFDIAQAAGGVDRAVWKQFDGVAVTDKLTLELVAKNAAPASKQMPLLNCIQILRR